MKILSDLFAVELLPTVNRVVSFLIRAVDLVVQLHRATNGWSTILGGVVTALGGVAAAFETVLGFLGLLGIGGGVAGGGALAGVAASAGTAGLVGADVGLGAYDISQGAKLFKTYKDSGAFDGMIKFFEGFSSTPYKDIAGNATIGYGHKIRPGENFSGGITSSAAAQLLTQDTASARAAVMQLVKVALNSNQMAALMDFVYNVGPSKFASSTLLRKLNSGDYAGAAGELERWNKAGGMVRGGLTTRRQSEEELFRSPVSVAQNTNIHVYGNDDPNAAGRAVASHQRQVNADLLRDMGAKVQWLRSDHHQ